MIGSGELEESLKEYSTLNKVQSSFIKFSQNPWGNYKTGDLLIVPSLYEGDGLIVLEAISQNIPILISDIPEFRRFSFPEINYAKELSDYLYKIKSIRKLDSMIIDPALVESIVSDRNPKYISNQWNQLINRILEDK